jgi:hypothetical protein
LPLAVSFVLIEVGEDLLGLTINLDAVRDHSLSPFLKLADPLWRSEFRALSDADP